MPRPRVVVVSSAEVYGIAGSAPLDEDTPLRPVSPVRGEQGRGGVRRASRPSSVEASRSSGSGPSTTWDPVRPSPSSSPRSLGVSSRPNAPGRPRCVSATSRAPRDFTDVRDVVRAYRLLAVLGVRASVYNVCSGVRGPDRRRSSTRSSPSRQRPVVPVDDPALAAADRPADSSSATGAGSRRSPVGSPRSRCARRSST